MKRVRLLLHALIPYPVEKERQAVNKHATLNNCSHAPCLPHAPAHVGNHAKRCPQAKLNEYEFPVKKVANVQSQLSRLIEKNYYLNKSAREVRGKARCSEERRMCICCKKA